MGTRSGDLDIGVLTYIMDKEEIGISQIGTLVNKQSGMLGITGISSDMREIEDAAFKDKNERAMLGSGYVSLPGKKIYRLLMLRPWVVLILLCLPVELVKTVLKPVKKYARDLEFLGIELDPEKNNGLRSKEAVISKDRCQGKSNGCSYQ